MAQEVREYKDHKEFEKDRGDWLRKGWRIIGVTEVPQRAGVMRFAALGLGARVIKPKSRVWVVYELTTPPDLGRIHWSCGHESPARDSPGVGEPWPIVGGYAARNVDVPDSVCPECAGRQ
jgi:hypothetical protein